MSDERPRPQYGEYATPEQQAAAMGKKYVPPVPEPVAAPPTPTNAGATYARPYPQRQPGYVNRFFTVFFLGLGALMLFADAPVYLNFASALRGAYESSGISITVPSSLNPAGIPILVANVILYLASVLLSILALRRGRIAFYIPVVGFIVFAITAGIIVTAISPAFATQFAK
jgi:hypothetical protein